MLFVALAISFVVTAGLAIEETTKPSIKESIYLCNVRIYRGKRDKGLSDSLDKALIFFLNVGEEVVEFSTFKNASSEAFDRLNLLGFIQCYDFPNNVPVIVSTTTLTKNVMNCDAIYNFFEEYSKTK